MVGLQKKLRFTFPLAAGASALVLTASPGRAAPGITLVSSFTGINGAVPAAALTAASGGLYYGTTAYGGAHDFGGVFEFNSATGAITLKDSFSGISDGAYPFAGLTAAGGGLYYGTTAYGGADDFGGVFEFNSSTGSISLKDSFTGVNGANPYAGLTAAGGGLYYGTAYNDGANGAGGVFEFNSSTGSISLKDSFTGINGSYPYAELTAAGGGLYYGTTPYGGDHNFGGVFEFNSSTGAITLKDSFSGISDGAYPFAGLTAAGGGLYYGTTENGGAHDFGGVFAFDSATSAITLKDSFTGINGSYPFAKLTAAGGGLYYGTTAIGGANGAGTIYSFNAVPGPLPLLGAAVAFRSSRRLRRRLKSAQAVHPPEALGSRHRPSGDFPRRRAQCRAALSTPGSSSIT